MTARPVSEINIIYDGCRSIAVASFQCECQTKNVASVPTNVMMYMWCSVQIRLISIHGHRMDDGARTKSWHQNDDCGVAMLSAIPERQEYVRQVRTVDFLQAYNDVDASSIGCSVCFARGARTVGDRKIG
jgi:hypothetical protein